MHGGGQGSGAPFANQNALKHGRYTSEAIAERKAFNRMLRKMREDLRDFEEKS